MMSWACSCLLMDRSRLRLLFSGLVTSALLDTKRKKILYQYPSIEHGFVHNRPVSVHIHTNTHSRLDLGLDLIKYDK